MKNVHDDITMVVEAEAHLPIASLQLVKIRIDHPSDYVRDGTDTYRLDLSLTPRPQDARACYREHWGRHRFERIGAAFVVPPGEVVETKSDATDLQRSLVCLLRPEPLREWFDGELEWPDRRLEASLDIRDTTVRTPLERLCGELKSPGIASNMLLELLAGQLAIGLGRYCATLKQGTKGGLAPWRLRILEERVNSDEPAPTLTELAKLCSLSVRALTAGFRVSRNISIGEYVTNAQMSQAKRLLLNGQSVKAVSYSLGFSSPAAFCVAFRRHQGETPGQYREHGLRH